MSRRIMSAGRRRENESAGRSIMRVRVERKGHKRGRDRRRIDAANQKNKRCDREVGRGQPLDRRVMDGIERPV